MIGRMYPKVNTSRNQLKLKRRLEELGHTKVEVWWEPVRNGPEMCGPEGGFFFSSEENILEPLGYSFEEAIECVEDYNMGF